MVTLIHRFLNQFRWIGRKNSNYDHYGPILQVLEINTVSSPAHSSRKSQNLFKQVFRYYGIPMKALYSYHIFYILERIYGKTRNHCLTSLTSEYHPPSNGQTKRINHKIGIYLWTYCSNSQEDYTKYLPWVGYAKNSLKHSATNLTLYQCVLGLQPSFFPWNLNNTGMPVSDEWFRRSEQVWEKHISILKMLQQQENN